MKKSLLAKGFTLLEVLIATVLLVVGVVAVTKAFSVGVFVSCEPEDVKVALNLAQAKLESLIGTTGGVANETPAVVSGFARFRRGVSTDDNNPEKVDVTVYWDTRGGEVNVSLTTLLLNTS